MTHEDRRFQVGFAGDVLLDLRPRLAARRGFPRGLEAVAHVVHPQRHLRRLRHIRGGNSLQHAQTSEAGLATTGRWSGGGTGAGADSPCVATDAFTVGTDTVGSGDGPACTTGRGSVFGVGSGRGAWGGVGAGGGGGSAAAACRGASWG